MSDGSFIVTDVVMVDKDIDSGSHGLLPRAASAGRFPVIIAVGGLFFTSLALIGGVHAPHEMVLAPMKRLALGNKTGVILLC